MTVSDQYGVNWVRQWVRLSRDGRQRSNDGRGPDERRKDRSLNSIHASAIPQGVPAKTNAAVVFGLLVALKSLLRRQEIRSGAERIHSRAQTGDVASDGNGNPWSGIRDACT